MVGLWAICSVGGPLVSGGRDGSWATENFKGVMLGSMLGGRF